MADPLIASAFVTIAPEPTSLKSFGPNVQRQLSSQLKTTPIKVTITPVLGTYKARIQGELRATKFVLPVTAVLAPKNKAALQAQLKGLSGLVVPVTGVVTGAVPGKGAGLAGSLTGSGISGGTKPPKEIPPQRTPKTVFDQTRKKATDALELATAKLNATRAEGISLDEQSRRTTKALIASENALTAAQKAQITLSDTVTKKQAARLQRDVAAAEKLQESVLARRADITSQKQIADAKPAAATAALSKEERQLESIQNARVRTANRLVKAETAGALMTTKFASARSVLLAKTAVLEAAENLHTAAVKAEAKAEATTSAAVRKRLSAEVAATKALQDKAAAEVRNAQAAYDSALANKQAGAAAAQRASSERLAARGGVATILQRLGARGATLAASGEFLAGAAVVTAIGKSVDLAADLEQELNVFNVAAEATAGQMVLVSEKAKQLGQDITLPAVSANDAAFAMTELAKAGLTVEDSMDAARGTLQLATAANLDNAEAVNITASALNAFGLAGSEAVHVADLLTGASNEAQGGIGEMGASLGNVASVARQVGVSIEDTVALLTLLAKNGIQGAEGGTALKMAMLRLIAPTDEAAQILKDLNIRVLDLNGNLRPEVFDEIQRAVDKLTPKLRNQALATIYGARAIRAQGVLGREGVAGLNAMREATDQQGLAAELAGARTQGFKGDVEALKNAMATFGLEIGEVVIPGLTQVIDSGIAIVNVLQDVADAADEADKALADIGPIGDLDLGKILGPLEEPIEFLGSSTGDVINDLRANLELIKRGDWIDPFKSAEQTLDRINQEVIEVASSSGALSEKLNETDGLTEAILLVKEMRSQLYGSGEEVEKTRERLDSVVRVLAALGRKPTAIELEALFKKGYIPESLYALQAELNRLPPLNVKAGFAKDSFVVTPEAREAVTSAGEKTENAFHLAFGKALTPDMKALFALAFGQAKVEAEIAGKEAAASFKQSFGTELALAELTPGVQDDLAAWNRALIQRNKNLARAQEAFANAKTPKAKAAADKWVRNAAAAVKEAEDAIATILKDQASKRKAAAEKIEQARNKADQDFLDAMGFKRGQYENQVLIAEGTARLTDDIKTHTALRDYIKKSIAEAEKTIKDQKLKAQVVQSLTADLIQENQTIDNLFQQLQASISERFQLRISIASIVGTVTSIRRLYAAWIEELKKALDEAKPGSKLALELKNEILQTQQAMYDAINEGFQLDIEIAQASENKKAEIAARERFIAQLKREQAQYKRGTLEWKRLQLEIINQQKAIDEVKGAQKDYNNSYQTMMFEFLQAQQGFAANLLGNLIPGSLTGLVGTGIPIGGTKPGAGVTAATAAISGIDPKTGRPLGESGRGAPKVGLPGGSLVPGGSVASAISKQSQISAGQLGPSRGQASDQIHLLRQIVHLLKEIKRGSDFPEARGQSARAASAHDYGSGGGGTATAA